MKRKNLISIALLLTLIMAFTGCGKAPESSVSENVSSISAASSEVSTEVKEKTPEVSLPEVSTEEPETVPFEKVIVTNEEDIITVPGFEAKDFYCEFLGNRGISAGWVYYYVDSLESGLAGTKYQCNMGNYACTVSFNVTNTLDTEVMLSDHISAKFVAKSGEYIPLIFYYNPDQYDKGGNFINSTVTVPLTSTEERHIQFMTNMPISEFDDIDITLIIYYDDIEIMNIICNDFMVEVY